MRKTREVTCQAIPYAFASYKFERDSKGTITDCRFTTVNDAFIQLTGLRWPDIIDESINTILPQLSQNDFDWIAHYKTVVNTGKTSTIAQYFQPLEKWLEISTFTPEPDCLVTIFRDFADREGTGEQSSKLDSAYHTAQHVAFILTDADTQGPKVLEFSPGAEKMLGYRRQEILGQRVDTLHVPDDVDRFQAVIKTTLAKGKIYALESTLIRKNGEKIPAQLTIYPLLAADGHPRGTIGVAVDISEQHKVQEELRVQKDMLRGILESQSNLIVRVDTSNRLIYVNEAYCRTFGKSPEELLGKSFAPLVHPEDLENTLNAMQKLHHPPYRVFVEQRAYTVQGWRWISWEDSAIMDDIGNVLEIQGVGRDITAEKESLAKLQEARDNLEREVCSRTQELKVVNEDLRKQIEINKKATASIKKEKNILIAILSSIGDGIIITDLGGTITYLNRKARTILELNHNPDANTTLGRVLKIPANKEETCYFSEPLTEYLCSQNDSLIQHTVVTVTGKRKLIFSNVTVFCNEEREKVGYVIAFRDITKQKEMESQLATNRKLEALGRMVAGVAHEINSPLQFMGDSAFYLQDSYYLIESLLAEAKSGKIRTETLSLLADVEENLPVALNDIMVGINRINQLITAMKGFVYPRRENKEFADVNEAVEAALVLSRREWRKEVQITKELDPVLPLVLCYLDEITQAVLNIILNSIYAVKQASQIKIIQQGEIFIKTAHLGRNVALMITDNGTGMTEEVKEKILEPFFTTKEVGEGTGQGLPIAYDIIRQHGGEISFQSEINAGTKATILLPTEQVARQKGLGL